MISENNILDKWKNIYQWKLSYETGKKLNDEVFNEALLIEVDDYQNYKENVMRNILSNNIKSVPVSARLDQGMN